MYALDKRTGNVLWQYDIRKDGDQHSFHGELLLADSLLLAGTDTPTGHIYAFHQKSGSVLWKYQVEGSGAPTDILRSGDNICTVVDDDIVICLRLQTGELVWRFQSPFDGEIHQLLVRSAALRGNRLFFGGYAGKVHALDAATGAEIWTANAGARISTSVVANDSSVFFGTADGKLFRLDQSTGAIKARTEVEQVAIGRPTLSEKALFVLVSEGGLMGQGYGRQLLAIDLSLQNRHWQLEPGSKWTATKTYLYENVLLTGNEFGEVVALDPATGKDVWFTTVDGTARSIGASGRFLFVGTIEGKVFAVELPE